MTRVLVVDDDPMVCAAIEIYLERHGFDVTIAGGGEAGLPFRLVPRKPTTLAISPSMAVRPPDETQLASPNRSIVRGKGLCTHAIVCSGTHSDRPVDCTRRVWGSYQSPAEVWPPTFGLGQAHF